MSALLEKMEAALRGVEGEVELSAQESRQGTTRFANSRVTQTGDVMDVTVQARVALGRRVGAARTNRLASINEAIARARELAAAQPESQFAGFDDGKLPAPNPAPSYDEATAEAGAAERARLVAPVFSSTGRHRLSAAGLALTSVNEAAVATTAGCRRAWRWTAARLDVIAADGDASARLGHFSTQGLPAIPAAELAERACERAARSRKTDRCSSPGAWDVILEPPAVTEMLEWLALTSLSARTVEDGAHRAWPVAPASRSPGARRFTTSALAGRDGCPTLPFDSEGTPKQRVTFIENGVARGPAHDRASAAPGPIVPVDGTRASAGRRGPSKVDPAPLHLCPAPARRHPAR